MRMFVAVDLDKSLKAKAAGIISEMEALDADVNFTRPENLHFTVKFLGEVGEDGVKEIEKAVSESAKGIRPFRMSLEGVDFFGNPKYIRTIWIGIVEGREELVKMCESMNTTLDHIRSEGREPSPHLTLGRVKSGRNREELLGKLRELKNVKLGKMEVNEITLKQSVLSREGPTYSDVKSFRLS